MFDKRGTGLSHRVSELPGLPHRHSSGRRGRGERLRSDGRRRQHRREAGRRRRARRDLPFRTGFWRAEQRHDAVAGEILD